MKYTNLGRSGLKVSQLGLGTLHFGPKLDSTESHTMLNHALSSGINFIDTANSYGRKPGEGISERIIGSWLSGQPTRRDAVVLATKVYGSMGDGPNDRGLSARHIISQCEASLRRLKTDWIDLYQMHHVDRSTPWEEIWQAMDTLVVQGKIRYVGSSNFAGWHIAQGCEAAKARHSLGIVSEQCLYNLVTRHAELEVIPAAQGYGVGVLVWSPLGAGALSGAIQKLAAGTADRSGASRSAQTVAAMGSTLRQWEDLCADGGMSPSQVALAWLLSRPGVSAPIIGPRTIEQLTDCLGSLDVSLSDDQRERLDELFPPIGVGGPSPEAWAW